LVIGVALGALALSTPAAAATIVVTNDLDPATAATTGDGVSLREAILSINQGSNFDVDVVATGSYGDHDTIVFQIAGGGVHTTSPATALDPLAVPVTIDGWTQGGTGYTGPPLIEINGAPMGTSIVGNGLTIDPTAHHSTIRGLIINGFDGAGIFVQGANSKV